MVQQIISNGRWIKDQRVRILLASLRRQYTQLQVPARHQGSLGGRGCVIGRGNCIRLHGEADVDASPRVHTGSLCHDRERERPAAIDEQIFVVTKSCYGRRSCQCVMSPAVLSLVMFLVPGFTFSSATICWIDWKCRTGKYRTELNRPIEINAHTSIVLNRTL